MTEVFIKTVNMSITASILVLVVLVLRLLLKKAPKWVSVLLWGLVAIRLICPFSIESACSLIPKTEWIVQKTGISEEDLALDSIPDSISAAPLPDSVLDKSVTITYIPIEPEIGMHRGISVPFVLACIWLTGIAALILYTVISYLRVYKRIRSAENLCDDIYTSPNVPSPFVFGIIRPRICLPAGMDEAGMHYVIAHEQAHIRRKDHLWKPLGFFLLAVHWFNPLLWLSYILLCRDIEMACDAYVVRDMGDLERADYSQALLEHSIRRRMISACPLAFGEVGVKVRIKSVLHYKKPAFWIVIMAITVCIAAAVCFLTNPVMTVDYTFDAQIADYDTMITGGSDSEQIEVRVSGKIEHNLFGKASFIGEIQIGGQRFDNSVNLSDITPVLSYYNGPRLVSSAYILAHSSSLDKIAIILLKTEDEPRRIVLCNMTYEEAVRMQKVNELPNPAENASGNDSYPPRVPYTIKITRPDLAIFTEPGYDNPDIGTLLDIGTYTITEESLDREGIMWGKLQSGIGWIDLDKAAAEAPHIPMTAEYAVDSKLNGTDYHEYMVTESEHMQKLLFQAYESLTNIRFTMLDYTDNGFQSGNTLYSLAEMTQDKPLVIGVVFYGDLTTYGLSFTDAAGTDHQYMIYLSGRNGSLIMQEYES